MSELDRLHNREAKMATNTKPSARTLFPCISKYCDENNGTGTNNWILGKNSNSDNIRRKNT